MEKDCIYDHTHSIKSRPNHSSPHHIYLETTQIVWPGGERERAEDLEKSVKAVGVTEICQLADITTLALACF